MCPQPDRTTNAAAERRRRRHARYYADFPVVVVMLRGDRYQRLEAHSKDLSAAGIGMLVADELSLSEVASLEFSLPGAQQPWELRAVLRHRRGYHYGFEFLSLTPPQRETLAAFLEQQVRIDTE